MSDHNSLGLPPGRPETEEERYRQTEEERLRRMHEVPSVPAGREASAVAGGVPSAVDACKHCGGAGERLSSNELDKVILCGCPAGHRLVAELEVLKTTFMREACDVASLTAGLHSTFGCNLCGRSVGVTLSGRCGDCYIASPLNARRIQVERINRERPQPVLGKSVGTSDEPRTVPQACAICGQLQPAGAHAMKGSTGYLLCFKCIKGGAEAIGLAAAPKDEEPDDALEAVMEFQDEALKMASRILARMSAGDDGARLRGQAAAIESLFRVGASRFRSGAR